jgi:hypothetical protein
LLSINISRNWGGRVYIGRRTTALSPWIFSRRFLSKLCDFFNNSKEILLSSRQE